MKFIINSQSLSKQLQAISGIITTNNTVPIVNCFHFSIEGNVLTAKATDLETTLITTIQLESGDVDGLQEIAVPARLLLDTLKNLDDVPMTFRSDPKDFSIEIVAGDGNFIIAGYSAETFPTLPELTDTSTITMTGSAFATAVTRTAFAASNDEMRQQMAGIFFKFSPEGMTTVATDAHKLVRYRRTDVHCDNEASFIMPRKPITLVKNIITSQKEECELTLEYNVSNITLSFSNMTIICRLIEGKYPNIEAAIPTNNPYKLTVDRFSFLNTLRRVGYYTSQSTHQVRLSMSERELTVSAEDIEFSNAAREKLPCTYDGDPMEIGFNERFLTEMVNNIDSENMVIEMSNPSRAGIILPLDTNEDEHKDENILMLVMPVMLPK